MTTKVTRETELNFEYQVRSRAERRAMGIDIGRVISSPTIKLPSPPAAAPTAGAAPIPPAATSSTPAAPAASAAPAAAPIPPAAAAGAASSAEAQASLPFQVQIRYTRLDGTKCLRVMTKTQRVTKSRAHAEQSISVRVVRARLAVAVVGDVIVVCRRRHHHGRRRRCCSKRHRCN